MRRSDLIRFELDYGDIDDNNGEDGKMLLLMMVSARSLIKLKLKYLLLPFAYFFCTFIHYTFFSLYSSSKRVFSSLSFPLLNLLGCFTFSLIPRFACLSLFHTCGAFLHNKLLSRHISLFT